MAMYSCIGLLVALVLVQSAALDQQIAFVKELEPVGHAKREVQLLPDNLNLELSAEKTIELNLKRMKNINHNLVKVTFDDPTLNKKDLNLNKYTIGYYQDRKKMASISIEAKTEGAFIKRTLTGTLVYNGKLYELVPASEELQKIDDILEEKGLGEEHSHRVHVLKEVDKKLLEVNDKHMYKKKQNKHSQPSKKEEKSAKISRLLQLITNLKTSVDKDNGQTATKREGDRQVIHLQNMFCIDFDIWKEFVDRFGEDAEKRLIYYYHHILNGLYLLYANIEDENLQIVVWLTRLHIITNEENMFYDESHKLAEQTSEYGVDCYNGQAVLNTLEKFREEQSIGPTDIDTFSLFTRKLLFSPMEDGFGGILGQAVDFCTPICTSKSNTVNIDNGLVTSHTLAHELAHLFGAYHDQDLQQDECAKAEFIMNNGDFTVNEDNLNTAWAFSSCSIQLFKDCFSGNGDFSGGGEKICLFNQECRHHQLLQNIDELIGTRYNADRQCQLYHGQGKLVSCSPMAPDICRNLRCAWPGNSCPTEVSTAYAGAGTRCDSADTNKVCYFGRCINRSEIPDSAIDDIACKGGPGPKPTAIAEKETGDEELKELHELKKDIDQVINGKKKMKEFLNKLKRGR